MGEPTQPSSPALLSQTRRDWRSIQLAVREVLVSGMLHDAGLPHAFTVRPDSLRVLPGPEHASAAQNRKEICSALGGDPNHLVYMEQVHRAEVAVLNEKLPKLPLPGADALVASRPDVTLLALSADCPIILAWDPDRGALGIAHAGWRGTVRSIAQRLITTMRDQLACRPTRVLAAISPCAGPQDYQVGPEVLAQAQSHQPDADAFFRREAGSLYLDLWSANVAQLHRAGVPLERIDLAARCTISDPAFFSYRRDGGATGHAGLLARLPGPLSL